MCGVWHGGYYECEGVLWWRRGYEVSGIFAGSEERELWRIWSRGEKIMKKLESGHLKSVVKRLRLSPTANAEDVHRLLEHVEAVEQELEGIKKEAEEMVLAQITTACCELLNIEQPPKVKEILAR